MKSREIIARLFKGEAAEIFRAMATLALGTGAARLIGVMALPLLSRIYLPSEYGLLSIYTSIILVISPVLSGRYVNAMPLPRTDVAAFNILVLSLILSVVLSLVLFLVFFFFSEKILVLFSADALSSFWPLIVLGIFGRAIYEALTMWATRKRNYGIIARTQIIQSSIGEFTKLGLGLAGLKPLGLVIGHFFSECGSIFSFFEKFRNDFKKKIKSVKKKRLCAVARHYYSFPLYRLPSQILMVFAVQAPIIFSSNLFGAEVTGQLALATMALALPVTLIGQSAGNAFYAEIASLPKGSEAKIKRLTHSMQKRLLLMGVPFALLLFFFGEPIFSVVFGDNWRTAGLYTSILSPYVLLQLTSSPLVQILNVYGAQGKFLAINMARTILLLLIYFFARKYEIFPESFVKILGLGLFLFYMVVSISIIVLVNKKARRAE